MIFNTFSTGGKSREDSMTFSAYEKPRRVPGEKSRIGPKALRVRSRLCENKRRILGRRAKRVDNDEGGGMARKRRKETRKKFWSTKQAGPEILQDAKGKDNLLH